MTELDRPDPDVVSQIGFDAEERVAATETGGYLFTLEQQKEPDGAFLRVIDAFVAVLGDGNWYN